MNINDIISSRQPLSQPQLIRSQEDVNKIQDLTAGSKIKYIDKTRGEALKEVRNKVDNAAIASKAFMFFGGVLAGLAIIAKCFAATFAIAGSVVAAATPIGWVALGLVVVSLAVLAARHAYMKSKHLETDTTRECVKTICAGLLGACIPSLLAGQIVNPYLLLSYTVLIPGLGITFIPAKVKFSEDPNNLCLFKDDKFRIEGKKVIISKEAFKNIDIDLFSLKLKEGLKEGLTEESVEKNIPPPPPKFPPPPTSPFKLQPPPPTSPPPTRQPRPPPPPIYP